MDDENLSNIISAGSNSENELTFTESQIEYLRTEFERQRRWIGTLSAREKAALNELEVTKSSVSYRIGRFLTWPLRRLQKLFSSKKYGIYHFVEEQSAGSETSELFASSSLITPDLLPEGGQKNNSDLLVEEILLAIRRNLLSVNGARDLILDSSYDMSDDDLFEALNRIMNHMNYVGEYRPTIRNLYVASLRALSSRDDKLAIDFGENWIDKVIDTRANRTLIQLHARNGNFKRPMEILKSMPRDNWRREQTKRFVTASRLLESGMKCNYPANKRINSNDKSIFYHAAQSMPHSTSGYSIRTHGLVDSVQKSGWDILVHLRHGYPLDRNDFNGTSIKTEEVVDGITYLFNPTSKMNLIPYTDVFSFSSLEKYQENSVRAIMKKSEDTKPAIIHSASNFVVGLAGAEAAKRLGVPSIYEIRGFWHLTQATKRLGYENSDHYKLSERLEIETAKKSDYVFTITNALKQILVDNGVEESKISVLPNAVDPERFEPVKRDIELEKELGFEGKIVIGYIGSFVEYEGLDLLLEAASELKKELGDIFRILLVGDGSIYEKLWRMSRFLAIEDIVTFTGRVPYEQVDRYYSLIDVVALPRLGLRVCELVSPLKPFEAMATGKVLITSDVEALSEIVEDGVTGLLHRKDDSSHLAEKLKLVITNQDLRTNLGTQARKWVSETHSWEVISKRLTDVYEKLLEGKR